MTVLRLIIRGLLQALLVLFGTVTVLFVVLYLLVPGDAAEVALGNRATPESLEILRRQWGLDQPLIVQYGKYLWRLVHFDLGESFARHRGVASIIGDHLPATAYLAGAALMLEAIIGCSWGVVRAMSRKRHNDLFSNVAGAMLLAVPVFFLGLLLQYIFAAKLDLLPLSGLGGWNPVYLILPAFTLATAQFVVIAMVVRASLGAEMKKPYMLAARARGLSRRDAILRHGLRNSAGPIATLLAIDLGSLMGGAMITEIVFSWPGLGRMAFIAIEDRDVPLVIGAVIVLVTIFVIINSLVDLLYGLLDPRIKLKDGTVG